MLFSSFFEAPSSVMNNGDFLFLGLKKEKKRKGLSFLFLFLSPPRE
jgi:hypothetical protein